MSKEFPFIPFRHQALLETEAMSATEHLFRRLSQRRSIRQFSSKPVETALLERIVAIAGTAPSGANKQPWTYCLVTNPELKKRIREAAEIEERANYEHRMSPEWLRDLAPLGTDEHKDFLEVAPALIVVFRRAYEMEGGQKRLNYYVQESVGVSCGFLIAALHLAGLVCLTHTPSPMNFLEKLLERPSNERAFLLIPLGFPAEEAMVPDISRKSISDILVRYD